MASRSRGGPIGTQLILDLMKIGIILRPVGPGEDKLGIQFAQLLGADRFALGLGEVMVRLVDLDGPVRQFHLAAQFGSIARRPCRSRLRRGSC